MILTQIPIFLEAHEVEQFVNMGNMNEVKKRMFINYLNEAKIFVEGKGIIETVSIEELNLNKLGLGSYKKEISRASFASVMLITIGDRLEHHLYEESSNGNLLKAIVYQGVGTMAVHKGADFLIKIVEREAKVKGYYLGERLAPGYQPWPIENQRNLVEILQSKKINVNVSDDAILSPQFTLSGLMLWYHTLPIPTLDECQICTRGNALNARRCLIGYSCQPS